MTLNTKVCALAEREPVPLKIAELLKVQILLSADSDPLPANAAAAPKKKVCASADREPAPANVANAGNMAIIVAERKPDPAKLLVNRNLPVV